jgi:hypothetical protein
VRDMVDPIVTFDHFRDFSEENLNDDDLQLSRLARNLAKRLYGRNVRATTTFSAREAEEVSQLLALAEDAPPSTSQSARIRIKSTTVCRSKSCENGRWKC